jgi:phytoene synthase
MAPAGAFEYCRRLVAETDKERHWSSLYVRADRRVALYALYAFDHEIARVAQVVREPMAGEIRLQWWREVLEGKRNEEAAANPVAAALLDIVARYELPRGKLVALIDARAGDLYGAPADLDAYADATAGTVVALAAGILGARGEAVEHIAQHIGRARIRADAGHSGEARGHLDAARAALTQVSPDILPALLPAAVIRTSLDRDKPLPLWRRQWLIWRAARTPARIF